MTVCRERSEEHVSPQPHGRGAHIGPCNLLAPHSDKPHQCGICGYEWEPDHSFTVDLGGGVSVAVERKSTNVVLMMERDGVVGRTVGTVRWTHTVTDVDRFVLALMQARAEGQILRGET